MNQQRALACSLLLLFSCLGRLSPIPKLAATFDKKKKKSSKIQGHHHSSNNDKECKRRTTRDVTALLQNTVEIIAQLIQVGANTIRIYDTRTLAFHSAHSI